MTKPYSKEDSTRNNRESKADKPLKRSAIKKKPKKETEKESMQEVKKKKSSSRKWIDALDSAFSKYVRLKHSDSDGNCKCYTCGSIFQWIYIQNGHYLSRRFMSIRWNLDNCRPQCQKCNLFSQGEQAIFHMKLTKEIGESKVMLLHVQSKNVWKADTVVLNILIGHYNKLVSDIKKEKCL